MKHMEGVTLIMNPLVNSYKRLVPGYEAPCYMAWSATNRSPLIRIPASRGERKPVWNCATWNRLQPNTALAVCLAAGIDGIRNKIEPPEEVPENVYELKEEEKASRGIESLPADLHAAICELQKDAFIKEVLGEHISSKLIEAKEAEWMQYRTQSKTGIRRSSIPHSRLFTLASACAPVVQTACTEYPLCVNIFFMPTATSGFEKAITMLLTIRSPVKSYTDTLRSPSRLPVYGTASILPLLPRSVCC